MFLISKVANPHFPPEVTTKVTVINFTITSESLEAQLLEICVKSERPELEETRQKLILKKFENQKQLDASE
jgi:dynein heavy chain